MSTLTLPVVVYNGGMLRPRVRVEVNGEPLVFFGGPVKFRDVFLAGGSALGVDASGLARGHYELQRVGDGMRWAVGDDLDLRDGDRLIVLWVGPMQAV